MKIFLSYRYTGEDPEEVRENVELICSALETAGHKSYCTFFDGQFFKGKDFSNKEILLHAFKEIKKADVLLAFVNSKEKSEGMLLEAGYALANKKPVYLLVREGVKTVFLREMAEKIIDFKDTEKLPGLLKNI